MKSWIQGWSTLRLRGAAAWAGAGLALLMIAGAAQAQYVPPPPSGDAGLRLDHPEGTLEALVDSLASASGVRMRVDSSRDAWWIRELPVKAYIRGASPVRTQRMLADLLDLSWVKRGEDDAPFYFLVQNRAGLDRQMAAAQDILTEPVRLIEESYSRMDEELARLEGMTDEEKARYLQDKPFLRFASETNLGSNYTQFASEFASLAAQGAQQNPGSEVYLTLPYSRMSPRQQRAVRDLGQAIGQFIVKVDADGDVLEELAEVNWQEVSVIIKTSNEGSGPEGEAVLAEVDLPGLPHQFSGFPLLNPDSPFAGMFAEAIRRVETGEDPESLDEWMQAEAERLVMSGGSRYRAPGGSESSELPEVFSRKIELSEEAGDVLKALADELGLTIVAENWKGQNSLPSDVPGATALEVLDTVCLVGGCTWTYQNGGILIRNENTPLERQAMIPESFKQKWEARARERHILTVDDLAEIALALTDGQCEKGLMQDRVFMPIAWMLTGERREALRLYGMLSASEREALRQGATPASLPLRVQKQLSVLGSELHFSFDPSREPGVLLRLSENYDTKENWQKGVPYGVEMVVQKDEETIASIGLHATELALPEAQPTPDEVAPEGAEGPGDQPAPAGQE